MKRYSGSVEVRYSGSVEVTITKSGRTKAAQKYALYVFQRRWGNMYEVLVPLREATDTPKFYDELARDILTSLLNISKRDPEVDTPLEVEGLERTGRLIHIRRTP